MAYAPRAKTAVSPVEPSGIGVLLVTSPVVQVLPPSADHRKTAPPSVPAAVIWICRIAR